MGKGARLRRERQAQQAEGARQVRKVVGSVPVEGTELSARTAIRFAAPDVVVPKAWRRGTDPRRPSVVFKPGSEFRVYGT